MYIGCIVMLCYVFCVVFCRPFLPSFTHCIVCTTTMYDFSLTPYDIFKLDIPGPEQDQDK